MFCITASSESESSCATSATPTCGSRPEKSDEPGTLDAVGERVAIDSATAAFAAFAAAARSTLVAAAARGPPLRAADALSTTFGGGAAGRAGALAAVRAAPPHTPPTAPALVGVIPTTDGATPVIADRDAAPCE